VMQDRLMHPLSSHTVMQDRLMHPLSSHTVMQDRLMHPLSSHTVMQDICMRLRFCVHTDRGFIRMSTHVHTNKHVHIHECWHGELTYPHSFSNLRFCAHVIHISQQLPAVMSVSQSVHPSIQPSVRPSTSQAGLDGLFTLQSKKVRSHRK
jgi:hypothetical protein